MSSAPGSFDHPIGLLHPGEMGAGIAAALVQAGYRVLWASEGRSKFSAERARAAGLEDVGSLADLAERSQVVLSICPPSNAYEVARLASRPGRLYVDANAISPRTSKEIASIVEASGGRYVDGSIIGRPPSREGDVRLYLSGPHAHLVAALFSTSIVMTPVLGDQIGLASALKMAFAAGSKGHLALLLAVRQYSVAEGVDEALLGEWRRSMPAAEAQYDDAVRLAETKGWRWVGEMDEIAQSFSDAGVTDGFHRGASEIYLSRSSRAVS
jgi:3-hydroxyisobutyrate dehydrogenase-like beta-hydroxyacid dehydrogenase